MCLALLTYSYVDKAEVNKKASISMQAGVKGKSSCYLEDFHLQNSLKAEP